MLSSKRLPLYLSLCAKNKINRKFAIPIPFFRHQLYRRIFYETSNDSALSGGYKIPLSHIFVTLTVEKDVKKWN